MSKLAEYGKKIKEFGDNVTGLFWTLVLLGLILLIII